MAESSPVQPAGPEGRPAVDPAAADRGRPAPTRGPVVIEITGRTVWRVIAIVLVTVVLLRAGRAASGLLGLVGISFFFGLALDPGVRSLHQRFGWRRGAAVGVIYAAGMAFVVFLVAILIPAVGQLAEQVSENAGTWVGNLNDWTQANLGVPVPGDAAAAAAPEAGDLVGNVVDDPLGTVLGFASAGAALVFNLATIAMFTFYFAADLPRIQRAVLRLFSPRNQARIGWTWDQAIVQTGGYFYSRILLMAINGLGFFISMALVGVPIGLAVGLAVFGGFVSEFIPAIGTYIGGAVPVAITLALQGLVPALVVLGYVLVYQQVENYWLSPKISADTMSLNGGVAFFAAMAGGAIAGPVGAFVALPVAALISSSISNYARSYEVVYDSQVEEMSHRRGRHDGGPDDDRDGTDTAADPAHDDEAR